MFRFFKKRCQIPTMMLSRMDLLIQKLFRLWQGWEVLFSWRSVISSSRWNAFQGMPANKLLHFWGKKKQRIPDFLKGVASNFILLSFKKQLIKIANQATIPRFFFDLRNWKFWSFRRGKINLWAKLTTMKGCMALLSPHRISVRFVNLWTKRVDLVHRERSPGIFVLQFFQLVVGADSVDWCLKIFFISNLKVHVQQDYTVQGVEIHENPCFLLIKKNKPENFGT